MEEANVQSVYGIVIQLLSKPSGLGDFFTFTVYWQFDCTLSGSGPSILFQLVQHQKLIFFQESCLLYLFLSTKGQLEPYMSIDNCLKNSLQMVSISCSLCHPIKTVSWER